MPILLTGNQTWAGNIIIRNKLILDDFPVPVFAFGHEKYRNAYTGLYARIRRSSDSAEADFGWVGNQPDWSSIIKFCGVGNAIYLTRLYNQGSYGGYLQQTTTGLQHQIEIESVTGEYATVFGETFMEQSFINPNTYINNDFHIFSAFNIIEYAYNNDIYCTIGSSTIGENGMNHYYSNFENSSADKCILKATGSWTTDFFNYNNIHIPGTPIVICHRRTGVYTSGLKNGSLFITDTGSSGPIYYGSDVKYYYNGKDIGVQMSHQYSFCQITFGEYLTSFYESRLNNYLINKYS